MLKNYFKITWRNHLQNKALSFINIFGLAIGMAFAMLIGLWIQFETSFDTFHKNADRIAIIRKNTLFNNEKNTQIGIPLPLSDELKNNYPEIKRVTRMDWGSHHSLMVGNDKFRKRGTYVDPDFLKMFSFPLVGGISFQLMDAPVERFCSTCIDRFFGRFPTGLLVNERLAAKV